MSSTSKNFDAPLGTKAIAFTDPEKRDSWESHGLDTYAVG